MKVAVTGAGGFVGRHVVGELKRRGIPVVAVLRPLSDIPEHLSDCEIVHIDLMDAPEDAFDLMGRPDALIHLAWGGLPNYRSSRHLDEELPAQVAFLKGLVESGLKNLVVTGTCFEYGMVSGALSEDLEPQPHTLYGQAKDLLRAKLQELQKQTPFALTWARLFYLYGEGQAETSLLAQLNTAIERGDKVFDMSGGEQLRDYLPIETVARYLVELMERGKSNGVVNVCSGEPLSVKALVARTILQRDADIEMNLGHYPYPDYEPMEFWGDCSRLHKLLGEA